MLTAVLQLHKIYIYQLHLSYLDGKHAQGFPVAIEFPNRNG